MSRSANIEVVRGLYQAFERQDLDAVLALLDHEVAWIFPGPEEIPYTGTYRGRERVREFFSSIGRHVEVESFTVGRIVGEGEVVIATGSERIRVTSTGRTFTMDWADAFTIRQGRIVRFQEYADTGAMLKAFTA